MKVLKNAFEAFMSLALRLILGSFMFGVAMVLLIFLIEAKMNKDARTLVKWWVIAVLAIVAVNMVACTKVVYVHDPTPYVVIPDAPWPTCEPNNVCTIAETVCSEANTPVVLIRKDYARPEVASFTRVHEDVHVTQMKKDCKGTVLRYVDSLSVRLRMEGEAYCEEGKERLRKSKNLTVVANWYSAMMQALFELDGASCNLKPP